MGRYFKKQISILVVFFLIILVIGIGAYFLFSPAPRQNCYDGIKNQGEEGIDCGGPCGPCERPRPLILFSQNFIPTLENNFDLVAKVENPNANWGMESVEYRFSLYDENDQLVGFKDGATYFLPQESKYIVEPRFTSLVMPTKIVLELKNPLWQKLKNFTELDLRVKDKNNQLIDNKYNQLSGGVENKSSYDLEKIEIVGLLFDENENIVGAGRTEIRTVLAGENRYFEINWPYEIPATISYSEVRVYSNIFLDENFIKVHVSPEELKEY